MHAPGTGYLRPKALGCGCVFCVPSVLLMVEETVDLAGLPLLKDGAPGGVCYPFGNFEFVMRNEMVSGDRRSGSLLSCVRRKGAEECLPLHLKVDKVKSVKNKLKDTKRAIKKGGKASKAYHHINVDGRTVKYARIVAFACGVECPGIQGWDMAIRIVHHEEYKRISYQGVKVWVGDDNGRLAYQTRSEHAHEHKLGKQ